MASRVQIRSRDKGLQALTKRIYGLGKVHLKVGVFSTEEKQGHNGKPTKVTVLMVAEWQEFGTATIPARSFIRAWFDENKAANTATMKSALQAVARGAITKERALDLLGLRFVAGIQKRISDGKALTEDGRGLADSTIKAKGSSVPLIDTGQLRSSITFELA